MTRLTRSVAQAAILSVLAAPLSPVQADPTRDIIIEQQREECRRLGGRYEYPKCYLPERSPNEPTRPDQACDWGCQFLIAILAAAAARAAYCKANPSKC